MRKGFNLAGDIKARRRLPVNYQGYVHHIPALVTACGLTLLLTLESWLPAAGNRRRRLRHTARNLTLWFLNALALALLACPYRKFHLAMKSPFYDDAAQISSSN